MKQTEKSIISIWFHKNSPELHKKVVFLHARSLQGCQAEFTKDLRSTEGTLLWTTILAGLYYILL